MIEEGKRKLMERGLKEMMEAVEKAVKKNEERKKTNS